MADFSFFLGGHDLEMLVIRDLARTAGCPVHDKGLSWGAKASAYRDDINAELGRDRRPVLVELKIDLSLPSERITVVDHHGIRAGASQSTSLHQVFSLLNLPRSGWTRWHDLVAANDRGYVPEMLKIGATREEIEKVRAADRAAQGITPEQEEAGARAVSEARTLAGGHLTVVSLPHNRCAVVTDRMERALGGPGCENLLVICPNEVNFFGDGKHVLMLNDEFPGGWFGGALPEKGFWGHRENSAEVLNFLRNSIDHPITSQSLAR